MADLVDVHFRTLTKWENGEIYPPYEKIVQISKEIEIPIPKLLGLETIDAKDSFNNNQQEGDNCILLNSGVITLGQKELEEFNKRFSFLEKIILSLQDEKMILLKMLRQGISDT